MRGQHVLEGFAGDGFGHWRMRIWVFGNWLYFLECEMKEWTGEIVDNPLSIVSGPQTSKILHVSANHLYYVQLDDEPLQDNPPTGDGDGEFERWACTKPKTLAQQLEYCHLFVVSQRGVAMCEVNTNADIHPYQLAERIAELLDAREMAEVSGMSGIQETCDVVDQEAIRRVMDWADGKD